MIAIVDYEVGNLRSVERALAAAGGRGHITSSPADLRRAAGVVLPGVGAFGAAMDRLSARGLVETLRDVAAAGTPILGICLGMQLLFQRGEESPDRAGLGLLPGSVPRFGPGVKVPHVGWNTVSPAERAGSLFEGIPANSYFYFVHSFYADTAPEIVLGWTEYGVRFPAAAGRNNLYGVQFHPEKSGGAGLALLRNFVALVHPGTGRAGR